MVQLRPSAPDLKINMVQTKAELQLDEKVKKLLNNEKELFKIKQITDPRHSLNPVIGLAINKILKYVKKSSPSQNLLIQVKNYWIPICDNFGMWRIRYQLEDRLFELNDKKTYKLVCSLVKRKQKVHKILFQSIVEIVSNQLHKAGIKDFEIKFRQKNIFGIYKKMKLKHKNINFMTDWFGIRVIVDTLPNCYKVIDILHYLWPPYRDSFIDYIKKPKPNGYQSLHTTLHCLDRQTVEFQIRTKKMDEIANYGSASHAIYKRLAS